MPNPDRPKVGPADPETRRKKLRETLDAERSDRAAERDSNASADAEKRRAAKKAKKGNTLGDLLDPSKPRERRVKGDDETLTDAVSRGVEMGSEKKRK
jgi:hypothetical protein